jgi:UDP-glucuronate 4-epimerase
MAPMLFTKAILAGEPIRVFNHGRMRRDFTYVGDIVEGVVRVLGKPARADGDGAPYAVYNIGNHEAVELETFIAMLERLLGRTPSATTRRCSRATFLPRMPRSTGSRR